MVDTVRIDKWLWAARFFKTRSLAAKAVNGGHVHVNGSRVKPARTVREGDQLVITKGSLAFDVTILELSERRGPAQVAQTLYVESEESKVRRERIREDRKLIRAPAAKPDRRPDKRERRKIRAFLKKD
ncbi:RNA-binding S4 domain-containing protein [Desulfogranum japonicum]|uniref:RNA-binding S4 domain-containing protein n=1 Tax=Desulfogranum japonicum TaxID=231447 RepID=UPI000420E623|nr:RNA-binding S4 domain-containing protein [Desulfogranum japonicum]